MLLPTKPSFIAKLRLSRPGGQLTILPGKFLFSAVKSRIQTNTYMVEELEPTEAAPPVSMILLEDSYGTNWDVLEVEDADCS